MTIKACLSAAAALSLCVATAASAQNRGSAEDQLACTPDVYRLCSQNIPDEDAIVSCLKGHRPQLSPGCRAVFSGLDAARPKPSGDDDD